MQNGKITEWVLKQKKRKKKGNWKIAKNTWIIWTIIRKSWKFEKKEEKEKENNEMRKMK